MKSSVSPQAANGDRITVSEIPALIFSAKIDFITLNGVYKPAPKGLVGKCFWPRKFRGTGLTIHDPTPSDLEALHRHYPNAGVFEAEIAVDVSPKKPTDELSHLNHLTAIKSEIFAKRLMPMFAPGLNSGFRGSYQPSPTGYRLQPFNRRVPSLEEQLLYGHREDPVQVKVYYKHRDDNRQLHWKRHVIRVEVRMGTEGLRHHKLMKVSDFMGFQFRKQLSPYFRLASGTTRACFRRRTQASPLVMVLNMRLHNEDQKHWNINGIGSFLRGGKREESGARPLRDQELNDRIGQALHRLQRCYSEQKFVCLGEATDDANPVSMRDSGTLSKSVITYQ